MKKICFFSTFYVSHMQSRVYYAEKYLPKETELFLITPKNENHYQLERTKIIEIGNLSKIAFIKFLRKFCKENEIDLLFNLGNPRQGLAMFIATLFTKTDYIIDILNDLFNGPKFEKNFREKCELILEEWILLIPAILFSKIVLLRSLDLQKKLKRFFFFIKNKIRFLEFIIDENIFKPQNKKVIRKKLNLPIKKDIVFFVGRVSYLKGADIVGELIKNNPEKLFVVGGKIIEKNLIDPNLKNVLLLGHKTLPELADYYNAADLALFTSRTEGYGLPPREAMLCRTPALSSNIDSLRNIKMTLKANLTVKDMQKEIDNFFSMTKKERDLLGKKSREYILRNNSYKVLEKEYLKIFE